MADGVPVTSALDGVRIVDFSRHMSAPYGTVVLGDFGADVIKVESVPGGDPSRRTGTAFVDGESGMFLQWNRSKRSIAVDMRTPEGLDVAKQLISTADVFVENYRPGVADDIGIGYDAMAALNPRLLYCSVSAFGSTGPLSQYPGTDPVIQAMSGVMSLTGEPDGGPLLVGVPMADYTGSMALVQGVLLGLLARERTGRGQKVDIPMLSVMVFGLTTRLASYWADGTDSVRFGSAHSVVAPYQAYRASDGDIVAGAWAPEAWPRFCAAVERPDLMDDPRFVTNADRVAHRPELNEILDRIFVKETVAEWEDRFHAANALFGEIATIGRILSHPQIEHLGIIRTVKHSKLGDIPQLAPPIVLSETPACVRQPPPLLGEHSVEILAESGFTDDQISELVATGVVLTAS
jgi:formyl-CoA transferase/CoA:oxalate CoA-transferase